MHRTSVPARRRHRTTPPLGPGDHPHRPVARRAPLAMIIGVVAARRPGRHPGRDAPHSVATDGLGRPRARRHPRAPVPRRAVQLRRAPASAGHPVAARIAPTCRTTPTTLAADSIVATTVANLTVRGAPGLGAERGSASLESGALSLRRRRADRRRRLPLVPPLGPRPAAEHRLRGRSETDPFNCPIWFGWVAAASRDRRAVARRAGHRDCPGDAAHRPRTSCIGSNRPRAPGLLRLRSVHVPWLLAGDPRRRRARAAPARRRTSRAAGSSARTSTTTWSSSTTSEDFGGIGVTVSIDPATGVDDARARHVGRGPRSPRRSGGPVVRRGCGRSSRRARAPEQLVLVCRGQMVVEAAHGVDGP